MHKNVRLPCLTVLLLAGSTTAPWAAASAAVNREIDGLLAALRTSGCQFQRNGTWYNGEKAASHLDRKRSYIDRRWGLRTTEDFIRYAGTGSSFTGKPYAVKCPDHAEVPSSVWLTGALKNWRAAHAVH